MLSVLTASEDVDMSERCLRKFCHALITNVRLAAGHVSSRAMLLTLIAFNSHPSHAQTEKVLYSFTNGPDGANPTAALILDGSGNLYGTAVNGGSTTCPSGCGTVFRLSPRGTDVVLYSFLEVPLARRLMVG